MKLTIWAASALALAASASATAQAAEWPGKKPDEFHTPTCVPRPTGGQRSQWNYGYLSSRQCQVDMLRTGLASETLSYKDVNQRAQEIRWYYDARAGRQQRWLDANAGVSTVGSAGYLASSGAGAVTQTYWGALALAPVVFTRSNAYEPTRDLFYGGSAGAELIAKRYDQIYWAARNLGRLGATGGIQDQAKAACDAASIGHNRVNAKAWAGLADDRKALVADYQAVAKSCEQLTLRRNYLDSLTAAAAIYVPPKDEQWTGQLANLFARDMLAFDAVLAHNDHDLRFTPFETLTNIAAAPFQLASTILTGNDSKQAIEALKTQATFQNMDLRLSDLVLPTAPPRIAEAQLAVSAASLARAELEGRDASDPGFVAVKQSLTELDLAVRRLGEAGQDLYTRDAWAAELRTAAAANRLTFSYDPTKSLVTVQVGPPAPPPQALAQAGGEKK